MKQVLGLVAIGDILIVSGILAISVSANEPAALSVVYPPAKHQTTAEKIFLIGTAAPEAEVLVNGKAIARSKAGHFAPSFPLKLGKNVFTLRHQDEELQLTVIRNSAVPEIPQEVAFAEDSLNPAVDIARLPGELVCFSAIAPPEAEIEVSLGDKNIALLPQNGIELPPNSAVLTAEAESAVNVITGTYQGCTAFETSGNLGKPIFELNLQGETVTQEGSGEVTIVDRSKIEVIEVTADPGVARTGASTNYSRLTPLPKGTRARVTGREGEWLRLDYGGWIKAEETQPLASKVPPHSLIRGITSRQVAGVTEIIFPLQTPVPVVVTQGDKRITLTLYNTTAQTDTIKLDSAPIIERLDWQQTTPTQIDYTFQLQNQRQWGYDLRYEGTNLIFTLRHPPKARSLVRPLAGIEILLDPGHGGEELGARGPTGYPEKEINLLMSKLIATELKRLGATVYLTRESDIDLSLQERVEIIDKTKPDLALSIHYNALPDSGDALNTQGISTFWYHPQAQDLASFLHSYLVKNLNRPDYGLFWNNLALTRPHTAPAILLELGFMINPDEFEWITDAREQQRLAGAIARGIRTWFTMVE
ncbi:N-acetylmuramoyl-L-alanine amidase [Myxosarcina sp. GI1(2024)]